MQTMELPEHARLALGSLIDAGDLQRVVIKLHRCPQDLDEGDLLHRVAKFDRYVLQELPLANIDLTEWQVDDALVDEYARRLATEPDHSPVIYDTVAPSMIDGIHRANARHRRGHQTVRAWVGLPEHLARGWQAWDGESDLEE